MNKRMIISKVDGRSIFNFFSITAGAINNKRDSAQTNTFSYSPRIAERTREAITNILKIKYTKKVLLCSWN